MSVICDLTGSTSTDHATKALLSSGVPKLETNLDAVYGNFFRDEECTCCGCGVLWIKLVLCVSLQEAGLANALFGGGEVIIRKDDNERRGKKRTDRYYP